MIEQFTFFWDGPFSQWHPSVFVGICITRQQLELLFRCIPPFPVPLNHSILKSSSLRLRYLSSILRFELVTETVTVEV